MKGIKPMRKIAMGMALASTALASPALAKEGAWYVGVDAGLMKVDGSTINRDGPELDHDEGSDFGLVVGHDFGGFRLETELSQKEASLEALGSFVAAGKTSHTSFMLNGMFDFGPDDGLQGFFGAGIGIARSSAESNTTGTAATWWRRQPHTTAHPRCCGPYTALHSGPAVRPNVATLGHAPVGLRSR